MLHFFYQTIHIKKKTRISPQIWNWYNLKSKKASFSTSFPPSTAARCSNTLTSSISDSQSTHTGVRSLKFQIFNINNSGWALALWELLSSPFLQLSPQRLSCRISIWIEMEGELWLIVSKLRLTTSVMKIPLKPMTWIKIMLCVEAVPRKKDIYWHCMLLRLFQFEIHRLKLYSASSPPPLVLFFALTWESFFATLTQS